MCPEDVKSRLLRGRDRDRASQEREKGRDIDGGVGVGASDGVGVGVGVSAGDGAVYRPPQPDGGPLTATSSPLTSLRPRNASIALASPGVDIAPWNPEVIFVGTGSGIYVLRMVPVVMQVAALLFRSPPEFEEAQALSELDRTGVTDVRIQQTRTKYAYDLFAEVR
jgi:hypothetical protein